MAELPLYSKGVDPMGAIYGGIDLDSERGERESIVVVSDVFTELSRFYR
jgi:hypothetical protein